MPPPRLETAVRPRFGPDALVVRLPGWVDLIGDPDSGGDGLLVTLAVESRVAEPGRPDPEEAVAVQAVLVDGRSGVIRPLSLGRGDVAALVIDSGVRPPHADRDRAIRRAECLEAARTLGKQSLRDVDENLWRRWHDELPEMLHRRAVHVRGEHARTLEFASAIDRGDWRHAGRLMLASQQSLIDDFEVSCAAVDTLWSLASAQPGVFGCRRAGGGFAGQVVAIVDAGSAREIVATVSDAYRRDTGRLPGWCVAAPVSQRSVEP